MAPEVTLRQAGSVFDESTGDQVHGLHVILKVKELRG